MSALGFRLAIVNDIVEVVTGPTIGNLFESHNATAPAKSFTLADLLRMTAHPTTGPKDRAPALTPYIADGKTKELAQSAPFHSLFIDHDHDDLSAEQVRALYAGVAFIAWTSSSHQLPKKSEPAAARWKVCLLLAQPLDAETAGSIAQGWALLHSTDKAQARPAQIAYAPNKVTPDAAYERIDGTDAPMLTVDHPLAVKALEALQRDQKAKQEAAAARPAKLRPVATGNQTSIIDKANASYDLTSIIEHHGYKRQGRAWLSPYSESGTAGVHIFRGHDGKERLYSWHGTADPLSQLNHDGHSLDAFDVLVELDHDGDFSRAVAALANDLDPDGQKQRQREFMKAKDRERIQPVGQVHKVSERKWPAPVDVFADYAVPAFPTECLPEAIGKWATEKAAGSGFDAGAYAFAGLVALTNSIDHRARLKIGTGWSQPPILWGGLYDPSGGGKSATMSSATAELEQIDAAKVAASVKAIVRWHKAAAEKGKDEPAKPKPPLEQRIVLDTTTEALSKLLADNPEGAMMFFDEITEFIGRMDVYSAGGGSKDRGVYLRAYDGGRITVNRARSDFPIEIENFSVGILAGMQPEKLAQLFKQKGSQSDGLYQRFLIYGFQPSGPACFTAKNCPLTEVNYSNLFRKVDEWNKAGVIRKSGAIMCAEALPEFEQYTNTLRNLAKRTPGKRFQEHLNRFAGIAARLMFGLHVAECASANKYRQEVSSETLGRVLEIMRAMYRHSEAAYALLDSTNGDVLRMVRSAAEAILSRQWETFKRGDLTRNATYWHGCDAGHAEAAIDLLIELGWLVDITPDDIRGKRGRKSDGAFAVNPDALGQFAEHTVRIREERATRYAAIQLAASERGNRPAIEAGI